MLKNVIALTGKLLKKAQQTLPDEAADAVQRLYTQITMLNNYINEEIENIEINSDLTDSAKKVARRKVLEKAGRKLEVLKAKKNYAALKRDLQAKLAAELSKDDDNIVKYLREREIRDRLAGLTPAQILSHFGEMLFDGSNLLLLDAILNAPLGFELLNEDTLNKLRLVRVKKISPEIASDLETVSELESIVGKMFVLVKKELDKLRMQELPLSVVQGTEDAPSDIQMCS